VSKQLYIVTWFDHLSLINEELFRFVYQVRSEDDTEAVLEGDCDEFAECDIYHFTRQFIDVDPLADNEFCGFVDFDGLKAGREDPLPVQSVQQIHCDIPRHELVEFGIGVDVHKLPHMLGVVPRHEPDDIALVAVAQPQRLPAGSQHRDGTWELHLYICIYMLSLCCLIKCQYIAMW